LHLQPGAMGVSIKTVNLEDGMPSVAQAQARLTSELQVARHSRVKVLKIIHGYGSSGVGGDLRIALQSTLRQMQQSGQIRDCIYGENWRKSDGCSWDLLKRFPELKDDRDFGRQNRGITVVVL
jgi:Smr domain